MGSRLILGSPIDALLDRLYARSASQDEASENDSSAPTAEAAHDAKETDARRYAFLSDKMMPLDREKAEFCYHICRALGARRVVEAGTSFGVSTLFLAAAVRDNVRRDGGQGIVIATECEPEKASAARANFAEAGLSEYIELREGDFRETLANIEAPVDFLLTDSWMSLARPALELVAPSLRDGAVVICDMTADAREDYRSYFEFILDPANRLRTMTLPFPAGLEFTVRSD